MTDTQLTKAEREELREVDSYLTGTTWQSEGATVFVNEAYQWEQGPTTIASATSYSSARGIAKMRNALPRLLAALEAAEDRAMRAEADLAAYVEDAKARVGAAEAERDSLKAKLAEAEAKLEKATTRQVYIDMREAQGKLAALVEAVSEAIARADADDEPFTQSPEDKAIEMRIRAAIEAAKVTT